MGGGEKIKRTINIDVKYLLAPRFSTVIFLLKKLIYRSYLLLFTNSPAKARRVRTESPGMPSAEGERGAGERRRPPLSPAK